MELLTPLFEKEFGYSINLHDAKIVDVEEWVEHGVKRAKWNLELYLPAAGEEVWEYYAYSLSFIGQSCSLTFLSGSEIFDFLVDKLSEKLLFRLIVLPSGMPLWFECESAQEVSLEPIP